VIEFLKPAISVKEETKDFARFTVQPLERGFGNTLGNSLRRVLLSSLPGAAVTSVRIEGVPHEFSSISGVREDVTDILLNLKSLVLKLESEEPAVLRLSAKGPADVKASDFDVPSEVEIVNPDLHIAKLNEDGKLEMEVTVETGRGYVSAERNKKPSDPIGIIPIDSAFCPVRRVTYDVQNTRVGQRTDYDKLTLEIGTDGSLESKEAVSLASKIMNEHMNLFMEQAPEEAEETVFVTGKEKKDQVLDSPIENLELSVRSYNCLKRQGVDNLEQLVECSENDLLNIRNFGAKSIQEVKDKLDELNLSLSSGD